MRNDAHDDIDELPELSTERIEPEFNAAATPNPSIHDNLRATAATPNHRSNKALGVLCALTLAVACASAAFGWWSIQRMQLLERQLIATQESFAKISEDAAGRISAITGKVSATESSVLSGNEALKERLSHLENKALETHKQQHIRLDQHDTGISTLSADLQLLTTQSSNLNSTLAAQKIVTEQQAITLTALQTDVAKQFQTQQTKLQRLEENLATQQQQLAPLTELQAAIKSINSKLATLQNNTEHSADITRLQQDILILRSELEQLPRNPAVHNTGPSLADFDAYRAQTNRTINALQEQIRSVQKNTP